MADETITLSRQEPEFASMNYRQLREEGIEYIRNLAGKVWTDYNIHDPGITVLEMLCYAITDLGYRTDFDVKDLLAGANGSQETNFHSVAQVATNNPVTIKDFRKLLIDVPGIRNAWLRKADQSENLDTINGLFDVLLELGQDDEFGDLNSPVFEATLNLSAPNVPQIEVELEMPAWIITPPEIDSIDEQLAPIESLEVNFVDVSGKDYAHVGEFTINKDTHNIELQFYVRTLSPLDGITVPALYRTDLKTQLESRADLIYRFIAKRAAIKKVMKEAEEKLHAFRNVCEDFKSIQPLNLQEIGLSLDLEVAPDVNKEELLAEIYFQVDKFISPSVKFKSLSDLLAEGKTAEEIFDGPALNNGFIADEDLEAAVQREVIFTSDLVQVIMDVEEVIAVKKIRIANYIFGDEMGKDAANCLQLSEPDLYIPKFSLRKSSANFIAGAGLPQQADKTLVQLRYDELKSLDLIGRLAGGQHDISIPIGTFRNAGDYFSVQNDFPLTYGLAEGGLPASATDQRKAQARQLKGYLLFFEQLLANYLSQLHNLGTLFSSKKTGVGADLVNSTYFSQPVFQAPDVNTLLKGFTDYAYLNGLDPDDPAAMETYLTDTGLPDSQNFEKQLSDINESPEVFNDRRNRLFDHLLGRFSESFTDYALYLKAKVGEGAANSQLINAKAGFLEDYPIISSGRGKSFDYKAVTTTGEPDLWDTENVSGLKKRICRQLGLTNLQRNRLSLVHYFELFEDTGSFYLRLVDDSGNNLLKSQASFANFEAAIPTILEIIEFGKDASQYDAPDGQVTFDLYNENTGGLIATEYGAFANEAARDQGIQDIIAFITSKEDDFNFHVAENVLFRPKASFHDGLSIETESDPNYSVTDPYSFRIHVILPAWHSLAQDESFRRVFKQTMRLESPAHVYLRFYWVDHEDMWEFEQFYAERLLENHKGNGISMKGIKFWAENQYRPQDGSNLRLLDSSFNANHAILKSGRSIQFDGVDDRVELGDDPSLTINEHFTMAIWFSTSTLSSSQLNLVSKDSTIHGWGGSINLRVDNANVWIDVANGVQNINLTSNDNFSDGKLHRVVATRSGTQLTLYVDNTVQGSLTLPANFDLSVADSHLRLAHLGGNFWFDGEEADFQWWNATWDADDVEFDYLYPEKNVLLREGTLLEKDNLKAWLPMTEGAGSILYDASGNNIHGSLVGSPTFPFCR